jgi:hypothetical protein
VTPMKPLGFTWLSAIKRHVGGADFFTEFLCLVIFTRDLL